MVARFCPYQPDKLLLWSPNAGGTIACLTLGSFGV